MDIKFLETGPIHDEGAEMRVIGPDNKPTDFYIKLAGRDSKLWLSIKRKIERQALAGENTQDAAKSLSEITLGWRGLSEGKKEIEFTQEMAERIYNNAPYICEQADEFVAKRVNFLKPASKK
jgi:hypothetical protein